jgi:dGTPase
MAPTRDRLTDWAGTMHGRTRPDGVVVAHQQGSQPPVAARRFDRVAREEAEGRLLAAGATRAVGAGDRAVPEPPDPERTCFERDRDRVLHSSAFRRLAGKTQVFVFPADHMRTRLTHALEVAQVATAVAAATGLNLPLTEAIALGHDCGHGPGGHASEEAFGAFLPEGYDHAVWGADVVLARLNLCRETLDGIRNHSWSRPAPATPEGAVVSWADRCAYTAHDLEDAVHAGVVAPGDLPADVRDVIGATRSEQLGTFVDALVACIRETGTVGMRADVAGALSALRAFCYERIYRRPASIRQAEAVCDVLRALVELFAGAPQLLPEPPADDAGSDAAVRAAVGYVAGMTDRYAFETAVTLLGWDRGRLPAGIDLIRRSDEIGEPGMGSHRDALRMARPR